MTKPKNKKMNGSGLRPFNSSNLSKHISSEILFHRARKAVSNIFRECYRNKEVSRVFSELDREFNHIEFHQVPKLSRGIS